MLRNMESPLSLAPCFAARFFCSSITGFNSLLLSNHQSLPFCSDQCQPKFVLCLIIFAVLKPAQRIFPTGDSLECKQLYDGGLIRLHRRSSRSVRSLQENGVSKLQSRCFYGIPVSLLHSALALERKGMEAAMVKVIAMKHYLIFFALRQ